MNSKLRSMLFVVGAIVIGVGANEARLALYTPQPATRSMAEMRDAGIAEGQPVAALASELTTPQTRRRLKKQQPDALRPRQVYARVLRSARCFGDKYLDGGVGNCLRPDGGSLGPFIEEVVEYRYTMPDGGREWFTGSLLVLPEGDLTPDTRNDGGVFSRIGTVPREAEVIIASLRRDLVGVDLDAGGTDDAGEDVEVDDSLQYRPDEMQLFHCNQVDALVDAGVLVNPHQTRFCGGLNRLAAQPLPCAIPLCLGSDGGWDDNAVVDCRATGPYGESDGGARWRGCNSVPTQFSVGSACVPVECGVVAGDDLVEEWRQ